jgi:hypothetical protein
MKVQELRDVLAKLEPEAQVMIFTSCCGCSGSIKDVRVDPGGIVWLEDEDR